MSTARSLADELRSRSDEALAQLFTARPDLLSPVPVDLAQLAARATTRTSVARALERLDRWHLQVLDAVVVRPDGCSAQGVAALLGLRSTAVREPLDHLHTQALVWGADDDLRPVRAVRELIGHPADLGPDVAALLGAASPVRLAQLCSDLGLPEPSNPAAAARSIAVRLADPADLLIDIPAPAQEILDRLTWGPPHGSVVDAHRSVDVAHVRSPIDWLLARGLVLAGDPGTVVLPREVALHLRGGVLYRSVSSTPPPVGGTSRAPDQVDRTAGQAASTALHLVEDLCECWGAEPASALRTGGLGVRELRRVAGVLDVTEEVAALVVGVAWAARLVELDGVADPHWAPTPAYDDWLDAKPAMRWVVLAGAWLDSWHVASLTGTRDDKGKAIAALSVDANRPSAPAVRRRALRIASDLRPTAPVPAELLERLRWQAPRGGGALLDATVQPTLREAELLGITGLGAASVSGTLLLDGDSEGAARTMSRLLPAPVEHVLLQADLTAIAPGPLRPDIARELALLANVESTGGATVYRFSDGSIRRGLDAGRTATELLDWLSTHSRTPVPQPLHYLVEDVARRHGRIRIGTAAAFVRSDDPAALTELLADRRAASLQLRRLAPTVLSAQALPEVVLDRLRTMGLAPAVETPDGELVLGRPESRRSAGDVARRTPAPGPPDPSLVSAAVRALRAGDRATTVSHRAPSTDAPTLRPGATPSETLAALRAALLTGKPLWIGYVDNSGAMSQRVVDPIRLDGGALTGFDHRLEQVRTFAVHRITGVAPITS